MCYANFSVWTFLQGMFSYPILMLSLQFSCDLHARHATSFVIVETLEDARVLPEVLCVCFGQCKACGKSWKKMQLSLYNPRGKGGPVGRPLRGWRCREEGKTVHLVPLALHRIHASFFYIRPARFLLCKDHKLFLDRCLNEDE